LPMVVGSEKFEIEIRFRRCWRRICVGHVLWSKLSEAWRSRFISETSTPPPQIRSFNHTPPLFASPIQDFE
jgi:hypothetical protein